MPGQRTSIGAVQHTTGEIRYGRKASFPRRSAGISGLSFPFGFLLLLLSAFLINFIGRTVAGPLMPVIEPELGIGHTTAGSYFLTLAIGYSVTLFLGQLLSSRLSQSRSSHYRLSGSDWCS